MFDPYSKTLGMRTRKVQGNKIRAVVIDNEDPEKRGRVKIRRRDLDDDVPDEDLPWAMPQEGYGSGGKNLGQVNVPAKNSVVFVDHQDNSLYHPQYSEGPSTDDKKVDDLTDNDYPHKVGHQDRAGNYSENNYKPAQQQQGGQQGLTAGEGGSGGSGQQEDKNEIKRIHQSGTGVEIDTKGNVKVTTAQEVNISVNGPAKFYVKGKCEIHSKEEVDIRAPKVNLNKGAPNNPTAAQARQKPKLENMSGKNKY